MPLTDTAVRNAKPAAKPFKLADGGGMFLLVTPNGARYWRMKYRIDGREKLLALGVYPDVPLKLARERRDEARKLLANGVDPSAQRQAAKVATADTFEAVAREWIAKYSPSWSPVHADNILRRISRNLFPWIGARPIGAITAPELLRVLRRIEERGALETAHRAHQNAGQVFRYAVATGRAERDPSGDLRGALPPVNSKRMASIVDPVRIGELLRAIDGYSGTFAVRCALRLAPMTFVRPGELRKAAWSEIDLDAAEWRIPAARMKMREEHVVPLATQAVAILRDLHPLTGSHAFLFPSARTSDRPMSENTVNAALRRLGYTGEEIVGHGFRAMASTRLNEMGWPSDPIERQLAHAERNKVRAAYNRAQHMPERVKMMQAWADYLDGLRAGANVVPIQRSGRRA